MTLNQEQKKFRRLHKNQCGYGESVTKSDSQDLGEKKAELFIGTGGDVKVSLYGGSVVTLKNIPSGTFLKGIFVNRVYSRGTTARDIVAIY